MARKSGKVSHTTYYRRRREAKAQRCTVAELPDRRGQHKTQCRGSEHPRWNHGRIKTEQGYTKIRVGRSHTLADPNGYAFEHHLIWKSAGYKLPNETDIYDVLHHKNGDRGDNRIENLEPMSKSDHHKLHNKDRQRDYRGRFLPKRAGRLLDGNLWNQIPEV